MIVLDSSALVDAVTDRPLRGEVLTHLGQPLVSPGHQLAEVSSAVCRPVRADELTATEGQSSLTEAALLVQQTVPPGAGLLATAYAMRDSIRVLDGLYVALAQRLGCPLLTTDTRLVRSNPPCEVLVP